MSELGFWAYFGLCCLLFRVLLWRRYGLRHNLVWHLAWMTGAIAALMVIAAQIDESFPYYSPSEFLMDFARIVIICPVIVGIAWGTDTSAN